MQIHLIGGQQADRHDGGRIRRYTAASAIRCRPALPNDKMTWYYLGLSLGADLPGTTRRPQATENTLEKSDDAFKRAIKLDADFRNAPLRGESF